MEKIIETKTCKHCSIKFDITDKDLEFYDKVSPVFDGVKYNIPTPTLCPDCRQQRRLSFRNERNLYKRTCDATGKNIISIYSPDKPYKVYSQEEWWSDKWDPKSYGREFDFGRGFFEQFEELIMEIPLPGIINTGSENCEYSQLLNSKDSYFSFVGLANQNVHYCHWIVSSSNCIDCYLCIGIENSYDCYLCNQNSYKLFSSINCQNSKELFFCWNTINCENCFLSGNIQNKKYIFKNKQLTKKEYFEQIDNYFTNNNYNSIKTERDKLMKSSFYKYGHLINSSDCIGDNIVNSSKCYNCYSITNGEDCKNFYDSSIGPFNNIYDGEYSRNSSLSYEIIQFNGNNSMFCFSCIPNANNILYSFYCSNSSHLFGCIGLRNSEYCILNKQYTREEYEELVPKIIEHMRSTGEWGEFFPSSISPFGYNETVANEYYPINPPLTPPGNQGGEENSPLILGEMSLGQRGYYKEDRFKWSTYENPTPQVSKTIPASKLPDNIADIPDDILNWAITCEVTGKPFRIIKQELEFYRKHNLPIPRRHPDQRHLDRMKLRNPRKLYDRKCDKCKVDIKTTYSPDREEIVYCEDCYNKEVF